MCVHGVVTRDLTRDLFRRPGEPPAAPGGHASRYQVRPRLPATSAAAASGHSTEAAGDSAGL